MTDAEWIEACDGLIAYYHGCVDSGVLDYALTARVREHWYAGCEIGKKILTLKLAQSLLAPDSPYGPEDLKEYLEWIIDEDFAR